jgi:transposase
MSRDNGIGAGAMVLADKAYDASAIRSQLHQQGVFVNIPARAGRKEPVVFSPHLYKARNVIERFFNKLKYFRRIATRYDKLGSTFLAMIKLAAIRVYLRTYEVAA